MIIIKAEELKSLNPDLEEIGETETIEIVPFDGYNQNYRGKITWIKHPNYEELRKLEGYFIIPKDRDESIIKQNLTLIKVKDPRLFFAKVLAKGENNFVIKLKGGEINPKITSKSRIGLNTIIEEGVKIGDNVEIGHNCSVLSGTTIGNNVKIGNNCVIGGDGFGYVYDAEEKKYLKLKHFGGVNINDDVEIGNNVTIDKGTLNNTHINEGVKIDNQTQIAHNVIIKKNTLIMSNVTISGSCIIGEKCWISPGVTIANKISIDDDVKIGTGSMIGKNLSAGFYMGNPARRIE